MKDDALIQIEGMQVLIKHLGLLEAERFITLTKRDAFDYTEWREDQFHDESMETVFREAAELRARNKRVEEMEKALSRLPKSAEKKSPARRRAAKRPVHV